MLIQVYGRCRRTSRQGNQLKNSWTSKTGGATRLCPFVVFGSLNKGKILPSQMEWLYLYQKSPLKAIKLPFCYWIVTRFLNKRAFYFIYQQVTMIIVCYRQTPNVKWTGRLRQSITYPVHLPSHFWNWRFPNVGKRTTLPRYYLHRWYKGKKIKSIIHCLP